MSAPIPLAGAWTLSEISNLQPRLSRLSWEQNQPQIINAENITCMDTAGAWLLSVFLTKFKSVKIHGLQSEHQALLTLVQQQTQKGQKIVKPVPMHYLARIGFQVFVLAAQFKNYLAFLGEVIFSIGAWIRSPRLIQWKLIFSTVEATGLYAMPIIALLSFLIGIVLSYQMGLQLRTYGANIYIVDLIGVSIFREFGPLITAIIVAGRSGSAFTAEIGTMQVNEELDALRTMGISPIDRLVLQKIFGLMIALPLLTVWANIMGILGGMVMANNILDISFYDFMIRFESSIKLKHYILGLIKTPVFAMVIACIGCYQGLQVRGSADSVGRQTTRSVVQAIFLIICIDASFSILYSWYNI
ncbi:MAG: MlaE family ABC transporter permease [Gammaproteobacteria bacterium]